MSKYQFRVEVSPRYLAEQSAPEQGLYMFSYTVKIANVGAVPAQLISRTWNVNDANGHTERVKGIQCVTDLLHQRLWTNQREFKHILAHSTRAVAQPLFKVMNIGTTAHELCIHHQLTM